MCLAAIHICIAAVDNPNSKSNNFYEEFHKKSLFTDRQISIIYNRITKQSSRENISAGAYYRQVKQCRIKIKSVLYSILLLRLCGALDREAMISLDKIALQLDVMSQALGHSDTTAGRTVQDVSTIVGKLIDTMCKV
ncbi:MAG TPA: hypothetical protein VJ799_14430 [Nitrososphaeraceae archaeon]|nr:hypothetical protein [Nitrososphaeraceae archaeon]